MDTQIRAGRASDIPQAVAVLAEAFASDATFTWIHRGDGARGKLLAAMFDGMLRHQHPITDGPLVAERAGALAAIAVWVPPGGWPPSRWRTLRMAPELVRAVDRATLRDFRDRGEPVEKALGQAHPRTPHWYLAALGVNSADQGSGVGSSLARAGVERARTAGVPAYLECDERLIGYYRRLGFEVTQHISMPDGAPPQVGMLAE